MLDLFVSEERLDTRAAVIGLTGGIGSGKSRVASMFIELGVPVLDLDSVGYQVTLPGSEGLAALVKQFGEEILDGDNLNRSMLAEICFASDEKTRLLNQIIHPLIWQQAERWQSQQKTPYVVIEASVLIESGGHDRVDSIIVVIAGEQVRKSRVLKRGNMNEETFKSIVARQCDDDARLRFANHVIRNDGDIKALNVRIKALHTELTLQYGS